MSISVEISKRSGGARRTLSGTYILRTEANLCNEVPKNCPQNESSSCAKRLQLFTFREVVLKPMLLAPA